MKKRETLYLSECGQYLARSLGGGNYEVWTKDGSIHWVDDDRIKTWEDAKQPRHPLPYAVGGSSNTMHGQKKNSFTLSLLHCDVKKIIEPYKGNTIIESMDVVFRRKTWRSVPTAPICLNHPSRMPQAMTRPAQNT